MKIKKPAEGIVELRDIYVPFVGEIDEPDWISVFRQKVFNRLLSVPFPSPALEAWRKISFSNFDIKKFPANIEPLASIRSNERGSDKYSVTYFNYLGKKEKEIVEKKLYTLLNNHLNDFFVLYSLCFFSPGLFVHIKENSVLEKEIQLDHLMHDTSLMSCPLTIIFAEKFTKFVVSENFSVPATEDLRFICPLTQIYLEPGASSGYITQEKFGNSVIHFRNIRSELKENSVSNCFYFNLGGYKGKTFISSDLKGTGSLTNTYGTGVFNKREFQDVDVSINHIEGRSASHLKIKAVVTDKAHHIFTGNLMIPKSSRHVDASQINNNLILKKTARAEAIPKLEVFSDDVKCSHGATMGEVAEDQLFYLNSRGLSDEEARFMIVEGFLSEIIDLIPSERIAGELRLYVEEKLSQPS
ncbi:MAG: Fe-S cluster assembly protein SufD [Leptospira sp.]|nr:Fe-S cluster assembly protein SufD [Leptospira sp.]